MGKVVECITPELKAFIEAQPLFLVATAPLRNGGSSAPMAGQVARVR